MFAQGGLCYFCNAQLSRAEASVEHLVPTSRAGSNSDDNCVACCKAVNNLLGCMSLKEKIKVVLNQKGNFKCPNGHGKASSAASKNSVASTKKLSSQAVSSEVLAAVVTDLKGRGKARPRRIKTLTSTIKSIHKLGLSNGQVVAVIAQLRSSGKVVVTGEKVAYKL
ncbi:MAG TPA: HNH endonuclease [Oleiagrimonas sp.]|nr:HNH endonuclease [Oleiagrimonas sp.]